MKSTTASRFDAERFIEERVEWVRGEVRGERAVAAVSGGVDSTTTAVLAHRALGERLTAVFLDDGLMREGEPENVTSTLKAMGLNALLYNVKDEFFAALKGMLDPEEKRKAFRHTFYHVLARVARELGVRILLQGTIAADVVETSRGVKTQHNVLTQLGIDPFKEYGFKVVEPLSQLYKHQVRAVARALRLPRGVIERRPFPGPGLAVRVIGEVSSEKVAIVRRATKIVEEETRNTPCFQAFAVLMSDQATGVSPNGERRYGRVVTVRAVDSTDAMTATSTKIPWETLERISRRIVESEPTVVRVLYDLTDKPPATIEFE